MLLGIDGGGTTTEVWLASREGDVRAAVTAPGSNARNGGASSAIDVLRQAITSALEQAGASDRDLAAVVVGLAGMGRALEREPLERWLKDRFGLTPCELVMDVELVLAAGTSRGQGLAVVSGTGSIAVGRSHSGQLVRAGGLGARHGDPGSGFAIGRAALRAAREAQEGSGPATALSEALARLSDGRSMRELAASLREPAGVAALAPIVADAAAGGDRVAAGILDQAGTDLAALAIEVIGRMDWTDGPVPVALGGGVLVSVEPVRTSFLGNLDRLGRTASPVTLVDKPVRGAISLAAQLVSADLVGR